MGLEPTGGERTVGEIESTWGFWGEKTEETEAVWHILAQVSPWQEKFSLATAAALLCKIHLQLRVVGLGSLEMAGIGHP